MATTATTNMIAATKPHRRSLDRLLFHATWALAVSVFCSVGWTALKPWDPAGPVSLLAAAEPVRMMLQTLALAAVVSAVATVLSGRRFADIGAFAVGIGLAAVSLRGNNMSYLLIEWNASPRLCLMLMVEALFWCGVMLVALLSTAITSKWTFGGSFDPEAEAAKVQSRSAMLSQNTAAGLPLVGRLFAEPFDRAAVSESSNGLKHLAVAAGIAIVLIRIFSTSAATPDRAIQHGQACFAVFAGLYIAVRQAQNMFPVGSHFWSCCCVPIVGLAAYAFAWSMSMRVGADHLPPVPPSHFLRALPITYISLGLSAVLIARWRTHEARAEQ